MGILTWRKTGQQRYNLGLDKLRPIYRISKDVLSNVWSDALLLEKRIHWRHIATQETAIGTSWNIFGTKDRRFENCGATIITCSVQVGDYLEVCRTTENPLHHLHEYSSAFIITSLRIHICTPRFWFWRRIAARMDAVISTEFPELA